VLGLRRLGHDVVLIEPVRSLERSAPYFRRLARAFALDAVLLERDSGRRIELTRQATDGADLFLNLSGVLREPVTADLAVYVDLDPGFTQAWHAQGIDMGFDRHQRFVTVGRSIGQATCPIPQCDREWLTIPQPIVLDHWPYAARVQHRAATSVGHWRSYGSPVYDGIHYGQRAHATRELIRIPELSRVEVLLALGIDPGEEDDLAALHRHGWKLADPARVASTPSAYRDREARLHGLRLGLVQRSKRLLSRLRPTGRRAGDRLLELAADRRRAAFVPDGGRGRERARRGGRRL